MGKLSNGRSDLETLVQDNLLPLQTNVSRPFDKSRNASSLFENECPGLVIERLRSAINGRWYVPIPKFLVFASKRGFFFVFSTLLAPKGAAQVSFQIRLGFGRLVIETSQHRG